MFIVIGINLGIKVMKSVFDTLPSWEQAKVVIVASKIFVLVDFFDGVSWSNPSTPSLVKFFIKNMCVGLASTLATRASKNLSEIPARKNLPTVGGVLIKVSHLMKIL